MLALLGFVASGGGVFCRAKFSVINIDGAAIPDDA
jgi:hypothetical protein